MKTIVNKSVIAAAMAAAMAGMTCVPAYAMTKHIDLEVDKDSIPGDNAGIAFMPEFVLSEDNDDDDITVDVEEGIEAGDNPTIPHYYTVTIHSGDESLDDDLTIRAKGAYTSSIDMVSEDNSEATGRLQVYPFYRLMTPEPVIDPGTGTASWAPVSYAGKYEYVIAYTTANGTEKTKHGKTDKTSVDVSAELALDDNKDIGIAVRALPTTDTGYETADIDYSTGMASWEAMDWTDKYRIKIKYTTKAGKEYTKEDTVTKTKYNVSSYLNSAADSSKVVVMVSASPKSNDHKYYNIAISEFGTAGGETVDTGRYDVEDPWEFLGEYDSIKDSSFASKINKTADTVKTVAGKAAEDSSWNRVTYRWQYLVNGVPYNAGWLAINNAWYYFDPDGYMHTGWLTDASGKRYYLESKIGDTNGQMVTGTREINGKTYVFAADGVCRN